MTMHTVELTDMEIEMIMEALDQMHSNTELDRDYRARVHDLWQGLDRFVDVQ